MTRETRTALHGVAVWAICLAGAWAAVWLIAAAVLTVF